MITLITATPGSGKTLYSIGLIWEALEKGRLVFTNINGLQVDKFPNSQNLQPAPDDWRDTPEGSLIFYDECQQQHLYPSTGKIGAVADARITALETHRHTGHDIVFITQAPTFVHHHIRKLVGEHIHLYRAFGLRSSQVYKWSHTCDNPNDRREQERADTFRFNFDKNHFKLYKSTTIDTHKFKMPKKGMVFLGVIAFFVFLVFFMASKGNLVKNILGEPANSVASAAPVLSSSLSSAASNPPDSPFSESFAGCVHFPSRELCRCYSASGEVLELEYKQCVDTINLPVKYSINPTLYSKS